MRKRTLTLIFGVIGAILWTLTVLLREVDGISGFNGLSFTLGIMPNFAATWVFIWAGEVIYETKNKKFMFKEAAKTATIIFICALLSEVVHDLFLNSPFDIYDIIATIAAVIVYLVTFYMNSIKKNIKENI